MNRRGVYPYAHPAIVIDRTGELARRQRQLVASWVIGALVGAAIVMGVLL